MSVKHHDFINKANEVNEEVLEYLKQLIEIESPTTDRDAVNQVLKVVREKMKQFSPSEELIVPSKHSERGDHLVLRFNGEDNQLKPNLIIAHMDTVWNIGTLEKMPYRVDENEDKIFGPGTFDMKGAIAQIFGALKVLNDLQEIPRRPLNILFNSDEEINSSTSREIIDIEAKKAAQVLILEGGVGEKVITSRKGILYFKVTAKGKSSHAGMDHEKGINAIEELAHQILEIQKITNYSKGTTVSTGIISGGTRTNVIPGEAIVEVDSRVSSMEEQERVISKMENLKPVLDGAELDIYTLVKRPPLVRDQKVVHLFNRAKDILAELEMSIDETSTGAISDGNLTAAAGIPTLDGLGPIGEGAHAVNESIVKSKFPERVAMLAKLIKDL